MDNHRLALGQACEYLHYFLYIYIQCIQLYYAVQFLSQNQCVL